MNRAGQLRSALQSCVNSALPDEVEFVIVDNASTDNTKEVVEEFFRHNNYPYKYEYEKENLGVGGGRNRGFELAEGDYVYFLDDDAVVAEDSYALFFTKPITLFESDAQIASITTRIYDELLECDRDVRIAKKSVNPECPDILMYLGGSHFLRRKYYDKPLYLDIKYGMEEILPSIVAIDKGYRNCYIHELCLLHQPRRNKWLPGTDEMKKIAIDYNVNMLGAKKLLYPWYMQPLIVFAFWSRNINQLGFNVKYLKMALKAAHQQNADGIVKKKVGFKTILAILKNFSISALI